MRRRRILAVLLPLLVVLLSLADLSAAEPRIFTDAAGRRVELPETIGKVMAAGPPASVLLYVLAPDKMAGWVREPSAEAKQFLAPPYRDMPAHGRLTGKENAIDMAAVIAAKPDLILDLGTVDQSYAALADRVQKETGVPYILIDGAFARTPQMLRELGDVLGAQKQAEELARHAETLLSRLATTAATVSAEERPRVYLARGEDGLETSTAGSINAEILASAGAVNVAEDPADEAHANVTLDEVRAWNPDVILALGADALTATKAPGWANIAAVAKGRVYAAPALPFGWMDNPPGVNRIIGAAWLTTVFYPGKAEVDLSRETHDFYKLFYHVELMQDQVDDLLAGSVPE